MTSPFARSNFPGSNESGLTGDWSGDSAGISLDIAVEMRSISKRFGSNLALNNIDLQLRTGEIHALLGENGAGKSTLMHILSGMMRYDSGEIIVEGVPAKFSSPRDARALGISMVHQHFALAPALTVAENLALDAVSPRGISFAALASRFHYNPLIAAGPALTMAQQLGWQIDPDRRVADLSVGEQQRLEIIKALATDARVLIFDEPTAVLIGDEIDELFNVLRTMRDQGRAIVLIAHKLAEIMAVADLVTVLRKGNKVLAGVSIANTSPAELAANMVGGLTAEKVPNTAPSNSPTATATASSVQRPVCTAIDISVEDDRGGAPIRNLSLDVNSGEIVGIGGVDGNGQKELAEALAGLKPIFSGTLDVVGTGVGYIPQDRREEGLALSMAVSDNLIIGAVQSSDFCKGPFLRKSKLTELSAALMSKFDIRAANSDVLASSLSGGNQQKIVVARALQADPAFIIAVNPTRGLDIGATRFVHDQLLVARDRGAGIILISTDLDELAAVADRTAILSGGVLTSYESNISSSEEIGLLLGGMMDQTHSGDDDG